MLSLARLEHPKERNFVERLMHILGIIDQWGNGLKLIADEVKEYPNIELKWREAGLSFQVQFVKTDFTPTENVGVNSADVGVNSADVGVNSENVGVNSVDVGVNNADVGVKEQIIELVKENGGINAKVIAMHFPDIVDRTVERYIKELKDNNIIEFRGAPKIGGYYIK